MKKVCCLLVCLLGWIANPVFAVRVTALYQGVLPVTSQSVSERNQITQQALEQVLIKVSGNKAVLDNPTVKTRLSSANSLMQEFSYIPSHLSEETKPYLLQLNFDPDGVNKILRDAQVPIWGQNRPLILLWLAQVVPGHSDEIIGADSNNALVVLLKQSADSRGVPVMFPAMDMQDLSQVSTSDIAILAAPKLINAAQRYGSDGILIGRIIQNADGYMTQWKLVMGVNQWSWNIMGKALPPVFTALADRLADILAGRYASVMTNEIQTKLAIKVLGISQAEDFSQMMDYIQHLTPVTHVEVVQVVGSEITLRISLRGAAELFGQTVSVGQRLIAQPRPDKDSSPLIYQWNH